MKLCAAAENQQPVEYKSQHHGQGSGTELTEDRPEAHLRGEHPHGQYADSQHTEIYSDEPQHFPSEEPVPGLEGPAAVDTVAVENPGTVTDDLGRDHRPLQRTGEQEKDNKIHQRIESAGNTEPDKPELEQFFDQTAKLFHSITPLFCP